MPGDVIAPLRPPYPDLTGAGEAIIAARGILGGETALGFPWFHRWPHVLISVATFIRRAPRPDTLAHTWWTAGVGPVHHPEASITGEHIRPPTPDELTAALQLRDPNATIIRRVYWDLRQHRGRGTLATFIEAEWVLKNLIDAAVAEQRRQDEAPRDGLAPPTPHPCG